MRNDNEKWWYPLFWGIVTWLFLRLIRNELRGAVKEICAVLREKT